MQRKKNLKQAGVSCGLSQILVMSIFFENNKSLSENMQRKKNLKQAGVSCGLSQILVMSIFFENNKSLSDAILP